MAKQTAVDIYRAKLISMSLHDIRKFFAKEAIYAEQAKAIEKEQIMKASRQGKSMAYGTIENISPEQYYKDNYENNK